MEVWQQEIKRALVSADDLARFGLIASFEKPKFERLLKHYRMLLPRYYAELIDKKDLRCPIRLQAIPDLREWENLPHHKADPLEDRLHQPAPHITHRYPNRLLMHLTPNCSMYCRYCFRKSLLNADRADFFGGTWHAAFDYVAKSKQVDEVILSGGDPLLLGDVAIRSVLEQLQGMAHLRRIRLHTRVPVTLPSRVSDSLIGLFNEVRNRLVVVVHYNHPKEFTQQSITASMKLKEVSGYLLNQSVLLRGVNDSAEILCKLSEKLFQSHILPYYLHHPDPALGTAYFGISRNEGREIFEAVRSRLPGYLVPKYVEDQVGMPYKSPVMEGML